MRTPMLFLAAALLLPRFIHEAPAAAVEDQAALMCTVDAVDEDVPSPAPAPRPKLGGGKVDDTACKAASGSCVAVSECAKGKGSMGEPSCGVAYEVCCMTNCPEETFSCCDKSAHFRPVCKDGSLECRDGQTKCD